MAKPIEFPGVNIRIGDGQPEYLPIPAMALQDDVGTKIYCYEFTSEEIEEIKKTGRIYLSQWTFNAPFQPINIVTSLDGLIELT